MSQPQPTRLSSFLSPLRLVWPAITVQWNSVKESIRSRGFAVLWAPVQQLDLGVANLFSLTSKGFIQYEDTTVVPSLVRGCRGKILELGTGPGNQIHRFDESLVETIYGIEPNPNFEKDIAERLEMSPIKSKYALINCGIEDSDILRRQGITEGSMDTVLSIQVMCAVQDPDAVMREVWKLLKPGGRFIFWEHGKSKDTWTAIAQNLWNPIWSTIVRCNLNRDVKAAILNAGEWEAVDEMGEDNDPMSLMPRNWGTLLKKA